MRQLDEGQSFVVTRNGAPVGELVPLHRHRFVETPVVIAAFRGAPAVGYSLFRDDLDRVVSQQPTPRG